MSIKQMLDFFILNTQVHFNREFGETKSNELMQSFIPKFNTIFEKNQHLMPDAVSETHAINPVFVIALEETLEKEVSKTQDLNRHVMTIYENIMKSYLDTQKVRFSKSENRWKLFQKETEGGNNALYDNDYFDLKLVQNDESSYGFDLNRCFYFDIFKANGKEELGPILCEFDNLEVRI